VPLAEWLRRLDERGWRRPPWVILVYVTALSLTTDYVSHHAGVLAACLATAVIWVPILCLDHHAFGIPIRWFGPWRGLRPATRDASDQPSSGGSDTSRTGDR
jgi:hypothetical protein